MGHKDYNLSVGYVRDVTSSSADETNAAIAAITKPRRRRLVTIVVITVTVEISLALIAHREPVLAYLIRPAYYVVAVVGAITTGHAARRRPGQDRRHTDRRQEGA